MITSKERYFAESSDRTHTLLAQIKTKNNEWVDYEKCYSKAGFSPQDYAWHWITIFGKAAIIDKIKNPKIRILNGMRKQVYSDATFSINTLFGCVGTNSDFKYCPFLDKKIFRPFAYDAKIVSIRFKNSELADILITDIETEAGWNKFVKVLQDLSFQNNGFKTFNQAALTSDDNNLHWYRVKCNSGLQFSFALYA